MEEMSPERRRARFKQSERKNCPRHTEPTYEERRDHGHYRTGLRYREWLDEKLREKVE